jgi:hypothetical protein
MGCNSTHNASIAAIRIGNGMQKNAVRGTLNNITPTTMMPLPTAGIAA